jgi:hypothetical protein
MRFQHRVFNIDCSATVGRDGFVGPAIIWRVTPDAEPEGIFRSGDLSSRRVSRYLSPQSCSQRLFKCGVRCHRDD